MESAPDGGRRRVLRPWGMRRTAPPTISPDMPDLADAAIPTRGTRLDPAVRFDFWIVGGLVVALVAVALINGTTRSSRNALHDASAQVAAGSAAYVSATTPPIVQEARLKAPPLVDVSPAATQPSAVTPRVTAAAPSPARGQARGPAAIPVVLAAQSAESASDDGRGEAPAPPVAPIQAHATAGVRSLAAPEERACAMRVRERRDRARDVRAGGTTRPLRRVLGTGGGLPDHPFRVRPVVRSGAFRRLRAARSPRMRIG